MWIVVDCGRGWGSQVLAQAVKEIESNTGGVVREIKWEIKTIERVLANINANCWHSLSINT